MLVLFFVFLPCYVSFNSTPGTPGDCINMGLHLGVSGFNV